MTTPTRVWRRDELLDEWVYLRSWGVSREDAARRLGMNQASFKRALERAKAAGDPRARAA